MAEDKRVEFIESYIKIGNSDYKWNDNHGELIRCKDCKHRYTEFGMDFCEKLDNMFYHYEDQEPIDADFYCKWGERKEDGK